MTSMLLELVHRFSELRRIVYLSVSTLALLALLGAASAGAQHSTERSTNDSEPLEWGLKVDGVRTSLAARAEEFPLGKPMLFRLVMENRRHRAVHYAIEPLHIRSTMSIERSDGANVPYIAGMPQTGFGDGVALNPRERTVVFEALDIADLYLLTSPGTYKVQFRGYDGGYPDFGNVRIPASNTVTIRVTDGPVKPSRLLARKVFDAVQASDWRVEIDREGDVIPVGRSAVNGTGLSLTSSHVTWIGDARRARVWVTASPSAIAPPNPDEQRWSPADAIGHCPWGEVYFWSPIASTEELSAIRKLTATALEIEGR